MLGPSLRHIQSNENNIVHYKQIQYRHLAESAALIAVCRG